LSLTGTIAQQRLVEILITVLEELPQRAGGDGEHDVVDRAAERSLDLLDLREIEGDRCEPPRGADLHVQRGLARGDDLMAYVGADVEASILDPVRTLQAVHARLGQPAAEARQGPEALFEQSGQGRERRCSAVPGLGVEDQGAADVHHGAFCGLFQLEKCRVERGQALSDRSHEQTLCAGGGSRERGRPLNSRQ
jgi:hypothetical protein